MIHDTADGPCACGAWHQPSDGVVTIEPDTQRVIPIETPRIRIGRQAARRKLEMAEELLREALPLLVEGPARRLPRDVFKRLHALGQDFNLTLRQER